MHPWIRIALPCSAVLALAGCSGGGSAGRYSTAPEAALAAPLSDAASTPHTITLGGTAIAYTATAGHLTATSPDGDAPEASFFYVAYTADGQEPGTRPVTFFYNGGPGSSSVWLHLGSFGPRRLVTGDPATTAPEPFPLVDNAECLLDATDLVFVDAVGTGLSEAIAPNTNQTFWGVDADAKAFRDFVRAYLAANRRQASPLYLFGESYGTPRTAILANLLAAAGLPPAGVILQSSILDYNSNGAAGAGTSCAGFLPTYSALGAYYRLDTPEPPDLPAFLQQMRSFTAGTYAPAVSAWLSSQTAPGPGLAAQLQGDTGIGAALWERELNLLPDDFQTSLVPDTLIGRYDGRVSAPVGSLLASEGDPSSTLISQSFTDAIGPYLRDSLGYADGLDYQVTGQANDTWDFSHDGQDLPDTIPDLAAALARYPALKILSLNGYHDLATPFYQTELDLARMGSQPNLGIKFYNGGHMIYLDDTSRPLEKADLMAFYQAAPGWASPGVPPAPGTASLAAAMAPAPPLLGAVPAPHEAPARPGGGLYDPYVPPARRHPAPGPAPSGAALAERVREKLLVRPGPAPDPGPR